jgi:uncharacterized protein
MHTLLTGALSIERVQVTIANLPDSHKGVRLVQLSDFHFDGDRLSPQLLQQAIAASNEAEPDLVVLTGDFITEEPEPIHELVPYLKQLQSRLGVYAVLGNHDIIYRRSRSTITTALTQIGVQVLWNQVVYPLGPEVALVGFADMWSPEYKPATLLEALDPALPRIVLSHNPDTAEKLQQWRVDLQLSGHTHGGQVVVPGLGAVSRYLAALYLVLPKPLKKRSHVLRECYRTAKHWEWAQGLHRVGQNQLYVNRGLGTYRPGRLFCPPEVTVITIV